MPEKKTRVDLRILSIDIGGSHIKATIVNEKGKLLQEYTKAKTPQPASPANILECMKQLTATLGKYDRISVGFPGYVRNGIVGTAPNLDTTLWAGTNLAKLVEKNLGKPAQVINDADMQGLGIVKGKGLEMVITLGTGMGMALLLDGVLLPHLEISHHPITGKKDYDEYIGKTVLKKIGENRWNERMKRVLAVLKTVFNYDTLYIGGGNALLLNFPLDKNIKTVSNRDGIKGGAKLWANFKK
jgi:polyphosphate glucokinase